MPGRFLADEHISRATISAILNVAREYHVAVDLVRVQDSELKGATDRLILQRAAEQDRALLTHDRQTIPKHAQARMSQHLPMTAVIVLDIRRSPGDAAYAVVDEVIRRDADNIKWENDIIWM